MCEAYDPTWGTPEFNKNESCAWKYTPCGNPCPATCDDPEPKDCPWKNLEGCYTECTDGKG